MSLQALRSRPGLSGGQVLTLSQDSAKPSAVSAPKALKQTYGAASARHVVATLEDHLLHLRDETRCHPGHARDIDLEGARRKALGFPTITLDGPVRSSRAPSKSTPRRKAFASTTCCRAELIAQAALHQGVDHQACAACALRGRLEDGRR